MKSRLLCVISFAAACIVLGASAEDARAQPQGNWTMKAPIPLARNEVALAAVGGKVHVIGGGIKGVAGTYQDEYDPATDRWRVRAPLSHGLDHVGAAVLNGEIYTAPPAGTAPPQRRPEGMCILLPVR